MKFEDLDRLGTEQEVRAEGLYLQKGRDYEVLDGDIIYFKFNVTAKAGKIDKNNPAKWVYEKSGCQMGWNVAHKLSPIIFPPNL